MPPDKPAELLRFPNEHKRCPEVRMAVFFLCLHRQHRLPQGLGTTEFTAALTVSLKHLHHQRYRGFTVDSPMGHHEALSACVEERPGQT